MTRKPAKKSPSKKKAAANSQIACVIGQMEKLMASGDLRKLFRDYKEESMANFAWSRVLERFLSADKAGAAAGLKKARKANRFVELYLSGQKGIPKQMPEMYSMGSDEEAVLVLDHMSCAWAKHKEAVFWLMEQLMAGAALNAVSARTKKRQ